MTTITKTVGSTLATLSHFNAYKIEVECIAGKLRGRRGRLVGLREEQYTSGPVCIRRHEDDPDSSAHTSYAQYHQVLPVLRPFDALSKPLADGEIPLIEVAKLAMGLSYSLDYPWEEAEILKDIREWSNGKSNLLRVRVKNHPSNTWVMEIDDAWDIATILRGLSTWPAKNQIAILNYLRSRHFAVGLTPDQFISK